MQSKPSKPGQLCLIRLTELRLACGLGDIGPRRRGAGLSHCDGGRGGSGAVGSSGSGEGVAAAGGLEGCSRGDGDGRQCSSISWSWWATNCDTGSG